MWTYNDDAGITVGMDTSIGLTLLFNVGRLESNDYEDKVLSISKRGVMTSTANSSKSKKYALNQNRNEAVSRIGHF